MSRFVTLTPVYLDDESDPVDILATAIYWIQPQTFSYRPRPGSGLGHWGDDHAGSTVYFNTRSLQVLEPPARVKELIEEAMGPQMVDWSAKYDRAAINADFGEIVKSYDAKKDRD